MNLLLVEDETPIADFLRRGLSAEGWSVTRVADGETALDLVRDHRFDVIVLDIMLPGISGFEVCARLRSRDKATPILMLSAMGEVDERVQGLRTGADDYLPKPFDFDELLARLDALTRRGQRSATGEEEVLSFGAIAYRPASRRVTVGDEEVDLTKRERDVLHLFLRQPDRLISRERLLNAVWGIHEDPQTNVVDVHIARLRKKLGPPGQALRTVRGEGYMLDSRAAADQAR